MRTTTTSAACGVTVATLLACGRIAFDARGDAGIDAGIDAGNVDPVGCADGVRDAFTDTGLYPMIAACGASWSGVPSLRAAPTGARCGNSLGPCAVPGDACSDGWELCGLGGDPAQISDQISAAACAMEGDITARFVAALSHCASFVGQCEYTPPYPCFENAGCAEPVCCGRGCNDNESCPDGVYAGATRTLGPGQTNCASLEATEVSGVLCCRT